MTLELFQGDLLADQRGKHHGGQVLSLTHLTLPTNREV